MKGPVFALPGSAGVRPHAVPLEGAELSTKNHEAAGSHPVPGFCLARERGRPARMLSLWLPLSFSAMPQAATLSGGNLQALAEGEPWRPPAC